MKRAMTNFLKSKRMIIGEFQLALKKISNENKN
jgi:hypothetical protein